jgi:hypothetical protein
MLGGFGVAAVLVPLCGWARAGAVLELLGLATVAAGLHGRGTAWRQPSALAAARDWLRQLPAAFAAPKSISGSGTITASAVVSGVGTIRRQPPARASLEERVSALEKESFELLPADLEQHVSDLTKRIERVAADTTRELADLTREHAGLSQTVKETDVGALHLERVGLAWLVVGVMMTMFSVPS